MKLNMSKHERKKLMKAFMIQLQIIESLKQAKKRAWMAILYLYKILLSADRKYFICLNTKVRLKIQNRRHMTMQKFVRSKLFAQELITKLAVSDQKGKSCAQNDLIIKGGLQLFIGQVKTKVLKKCNETIASIFKSMMLAFKLKQKFDLHLTNKISWAMRLKAHSRNYRTNFQLFQKDWDKSIMYFVNYEDAKVGDQESENLPKYQNDIDNFNLSIVKRLYKVIYNLRQNYFLTYKHNLKKNGHVAIKDIPTIRDTEVQLLEQPKKETISYSIAHKLTTKAKNSKRNIASRRSIVSISDIGSVKGIEKSLRNVGSGKGIKISNHKKSILIPNFVKIDEEYIGPQQTSILNLPDVGSGNELLVPLINPGLPQITSFNDLGNLDNNLRNLNNDQLLESLQALKAKPTEPEDSLHTNQLDDEIRLKTDRTSKQARFSLENVINFTETSNHQKKDVFYTIFLDSIHSWRTGKYCKVLELMDHQTKKKLRQTKSMMNLSSKRRKVRHSVVNLGPSSLGDIDEEEGENYAETKVGQKKFFENEESKKFHLDSPEDFYKVVILQTVDFITDNGKESIKNGVKNIYQSNSQINAHMMMEYLHLKQDRFDKLSSPLARMTVQNLPTNNRTPKNAKNFNAKTLVRRPSIRNDNVTQSLQNIGQRINNVSSPKNGTKKN